MWESLSYKLCSVILFLWLLSSGLFAQNPVLDPVLLSDPKDFGGRVNAIYQDKLGFIWIGKETGLFRFDGYQLKSYKYDPADPKSIGSNNILSIQGDTAGYLWIGTKGGGLNRFDPKSGDFIRFLHSDSDSSSISFNEIYTIFPVDSGRFLIGTDGGGFDYFDPATGNFERFLQNSTNSDEFHSNKILCFKKSTGRKYWFGTWEGGLHQFDLDKKKVIHFGKGTRFDNCNIFAIAEVSPGILWLGTWGDGLISYNINDEQFTKMPLPEFVKNCRSIQVGKNGIVWIGTNKGFLKFTMADSKFQLIENTHSSLEDISTAFIDKTNTVWAGSEYGSIGMINLHRKKFFVLPYSVAFYDQPVLSVLTSGKKDEIYFSSLNSLVLYNTQTSHFKVFKTPFSDLVSMLEIPGMNSILCASSDGLSTFDMKNEKFTKIHVDFKNDSKLANVQILMIAKKDSLHYWVGVNGGAYQIFYDSNAGTWESDISYYAGMNTDLSPSHYQTGFATDSRGNLWIGCWGGGVDLLKRGSSQFVYMQNNENNERSISDNFVECLERDLKDNIWIGTHAGLNMVNNRDTVFRRFTVSDGLENDWIASICFDSRNRLWISTKGGISSISEDGTILKNYDDSDGLPANAFCPRSAAKDRAGNLYFGSTRGLVWFNPDSINDNLYVPDVVITDFVINNEPVSVTESSPLHQNIEFTKEIHLSHKQKTFYFQLAALSYFNPKKNRVKYILKGYDEKWHFAGPDRIAQYEMVPPGDYTFSVIGSNSDGIWDKKPKTINITISKSFWASGYAVAIYLAIIILILLSVQFYFRPFFKRISLFEASIAVKDGKTNIDYIQPSKVILESAEMKFLNKAMGVVETNIENSDLSVDIMCDKMNVSRSQLYRKLNTYAGLSITEFIKEVRLKRAAQLLLQNPESICEIAYLVGFNDPKYFSKCFKKKYGVSPSHFREEDDQFKNQPGHLPLPQDVV